jgi:hypothetical protein
MFSYWCPFVHHCWFVTFSGPLFKFSKGFREVISWGLTGVGVPTNTLIVVIAASTHTRATAASPSCRTLAICTARKTLIFILTKHLGNHRDGKDYKRRQKYFLTLPEHFEDTRDDSTKCTTSKSCDRCTGE